MHWRPAIGAAPRYYAPLRLALLCRGIHLCTAADCPSWYVLPSIVRLRRCAPTVRSEQPCYSPGYAPDGCTRRCIAMHAIPCGAPAACYCGSAEVILRGVIAARYRQRRGIIAPGSDVLGTFEHVSPLVRLCGAPVLHAMASAEVMLCAWLLVHAPMHRRASDLLRCPTVVLCH